MNCFKYFRGEQIAQALKAALIIKCLLAITRFRADFPELSIFKKASRETQDNKKTLLRYLVLDYGCRSLDAGRKMRDTLVAYTLFQRPNTLNETELKAQLALLHELHDEFMQAYPLTVDLRPIALYYDARATIYAAIENLMYETTAYLLARLLLSNKKEEAQSVLQSYPEKSDGIRSFVHALFGNDHTGDTFLNKGDGHRTVP